MERSDIISRLPGLLTALFAAVLPFVMSRHLFYGSLNAKYFFIVGFVTLAGLYLAYLLIRGRHTVVLRRRWLLVALGGMLAVHYLTAFFGMYPAGSLWSDILRSTGVFFLTYVGFLAFWASEVLTKRDWTLVWRAVAVSTGVFALLSFFGQEGLQTAGQFLTVNFEVHGLTFGNSTFAGAYLLLGFILTLIAFVDSEKGSKARWFFGTLAVIEFLSPLFFGHMLWAGVASLGDIFGDPGSILGAARASGATALAVLLYLTGFRLIRRFTTERVRRHTVWSWRGAWVVGMLAAVLLLFIPGSFVQERYIEESTAARIIVWEAGLDMFQERPLLGAGPENFHLAFYRHFDNRLHLKENIGEVWFDRAHNIVVDTLVTTGALGALAYLALTVLFLRVVARARMSGIMGTTKAELLYLLPFAHFLQLQTSFDTVATYALTALILGYALFLERKMAAGVEAESVLAGTAPAIGQQVVGGVLLAALLVGAVYLLVAEYGRQNALFLIFNTTNTERHLALIDRALAGPPRFEPLRLASASLIKGGLLQFAQTLPEERPAVAEKILTELEAYERHYKRYLSQLPDEYRARMNYAYLLLVTTALGGENRIVEAKALVEDSYRLSPENPITYALDALATLYGGDIAGAKTKADEALALNPDLPFTQEIHEHIMRTAERFPRVTVLKLENL